MTQVTAAMVKQLREMTDSPVLECKKALVEADGDLDKAVDILRTIGVAKAVKKAGRATNEGTIGAAVTEDGHAGALVEVTCETDFVAKNSKFTSFAQRVAALAIEYAPADVEALKACAFDEKGTVADALTEMIHTMGENMKITRMVRRAGEKGFLASYVHLGGKLAVLVEFSCEHSQTFSHDAFKTFAHDVAMQVAAGNPLCARRENVPAETIERELSIYKAQAAESGKPPAIQERMAEGRLEKFFKEMVLTEQDFIKDSSVTVGQLAERIGKECGDTITLTGFDRFAFGA